jgi:hypothetical protein
MKEGKGWLVVRLCYDKRGKAWSSLVIKFSNESSALNFHFLIN